MTQTDTLFTFEGKKYRVGIEAYNKRCHIVLPDNRILAVGRWSERHPPQATDLKVNRELLLGSTPEETASLISGVVARNA